MTTINYAALGFSLTLREAAHAADTTPGQLLDAVRSGHISYLVDNDGKAAPQACLRFHPEAVRDFHDRVRDQKANVDLRQTLRAQEAIKLYLANVEPMEDYDQAFAASAPVYGRTRKGMAVHIRPDSVGAFLHERALPTTGAGEEMVRRALQRLGSVRVRGIVPVNEDAGKQRWATWWRLPPSLLPDHVEDEAAVAEDAIRGTMVEQGEQVQLRKQGTKGRPEPELASVTLGEPTPDPEPTAEVADPWDE